MWIRKLKKSKSHLFLCEFTQTERNLKLKNLFIINKKLLISYSSKNSIRNYWTCVVKKCMKIFRVKTISLTSSVNFWQFRSVDGLYSCLLRLLDLYNNLIVHSLGLLDRQSKHYRIGKVSRDMRPELTYHFCHFLHLNFDLINSIDFEQ